MRGESDWWFEGGWFGVKNSHVFSFKVLNWYPNMTMNIPSEARNRILDLPQEIVPEQIEHVGDQAYLKFDGFIVAINPMKLWFSFNGVKTIEVNINGAPVLAQNDELHMQLKGRVEVQVV